MAFSPLVNTRCVKAMVKKRIAGWIFGIGLVITLLGVFWVFKEIGRSPEPAEWPPTSDTMATVLKEPLKVPAFTLTDQHGGTFTTDSLRGHWTFLFFGYTYCPDVCPTTLGALAHVTRLLEKEKIFPPPKTVFVSVDPERDDKLEHLARYTSYFHPDFLGVTGSEQEILALAKPLGIYYRKDSTKSTAADYLIDHSAAILLIDPDGRLRALTSPPHIADSIAIDFVKISKKYE